MDLLLLAIGFILMIKGASFFVDGSVQIAKTFKVSPLFIGLTIVAFGTSAPEASVSFIAAINHQSDISLGNVIGSNLFNILFILGITALINPIPIKESIIIREIPFAILSCILLIVFYFNRNKTISIVEGSILFLIFIGLLYMLFKQGKTKTINEDPQQPIIKSISFFTLGLAMIIFGGTLTTHSASNIASFLGISQLLVGLTVLSIGTSLPELITSIVAAVKKQNDIAIGNIIGSNIFNVYFILGIASMITPISFSNRIIVDLIILTIITLLVLIFAMTNRSVSKKEGIILLGIYMMYMAYILIRN
jgi:cation:H+ antiporter